MPRELIHSLPDEVRRRLGVPDEALIDASLCAVRATRRGPVLAEQRARKVELRSSDDGTRTLVGYALTWDVAYDVAGGPPWGWSETIVRGALDKSLNEINSRKSAGYDEPVDVRFLANHDGLSLARSRGLAIDTMSLRADDMGLLVEASLDERNPEALALISAVERGDVDQMSWAFRAIRQEWNDDYTERRVVEAQIFDVSGVTYPANPATILGARSGADHGEPTGHYPLSLALAQSAVLG